MWCLIRFLFVGWFLLCLNLSCLTSFQFLLNHLLWYLVAHIKQSNSHSSSVYQIFQCFPVFFFFNPVCSSISVCCKTPAEFLALSPSSWTSPSLSMKRYPGWHVGRPLWLAEWSGWLQTSQICSTLLPVAFSFFCVCVVVCGKRWVDM